MRAILRYRGAEDAVRTVDLLLVAEIAVPVEQPRRAHEAPDGDPHVVPGTLRERLRTVVQGEGELLGLQGRNEDLRERPARHEIDDLPVSRRDAADDVARPFRDPRTDALGQGEGGRDAGSVERQRLPRRVSREAGEDEVEAILGEVVRQLQLGGDLGRRGEVPDLGLEVGPAGGGQHRERGDLPELVGRRVVFLLQDGAAHPQGHVDRLPIVVRGVDAEHSRLGVGALDVVEAVRRHEDRAVVTGRVVHVGPGRRVDHAAGEHLRAVVRVADRSVALHPVRASVVHGAVGPSVALRQIQRRPETPTAA